MPITKCAACDGETFEAARHKTAGGTEVVLVRCDECGAAVGALDPVDMAAALTRLQGVIGDLALKVDKLSADVKSMGRNLR